jgi:hypothetical protein
VKSKWEAEWESMTIDELFQLRGLMHAVLMERLETKKAEIELKLQRLNLPEGDAE